MFLFSGRRLAALPGAGTEPPLSRALVFFLMGVVLLAVAVVAMWVLRGTNYYFFPELPILHTNEAYVEEVRRGPLNLQDVVAVFSHVLSQLPRTVDVYPTENYYYFRFWTSGQEVWGNLRLDVEEREKGLVSFAYFTHPGVPRGLLPEPVSQHKNFGPADGLSLVRRGPLTYLLAYKSERVTFRLHDLPQTLPEGLELRGEEEFISRTFDESGFQFVLVYDTRAKGFRFLLDPSAPLPDILQEGGEGMRLGYRTGFAFYDDTERRRAVLIGVSADNIDRNNYYDGPFDQLADNTLAETKFQEFAQQTYRSVRLDKRGFFLNEGGEKEGNRLALQPYMAYRSIDQLRWLLWYCRNKAPNDDRLACLTKDPNTGDEPVADTRSGNRGS